MPAVTHKRVKILKRRKIEDQKEGFHREFSFLYVKWNYRKNNVPGPHCKCEKALTVKILSKLAKP